MAQLTVAGDATPRVGSGDRTPGAGEPPSPTQGSRVSGPAPRWEIAHMLSPHLQAHFVNATYNDRIKRRRRFTR
jgi:hypothetical protein